MAVKPFRFRACTAIPTSLNTTTCRDFFLINTTYCGVGAIEQMGLEDINPTPAWGDYNLILPRFRCRWLRYIFWQPPGNLSSQAFADSWQFPQPRLTPGLV